ncbi:MAG: ATP-binding protein [Luteolibacter sp.]
MRLARLRITVDNAYELFLDGQSIGRGNGWHNFIEYDVKLFLHPGTHVLAVSALNDFDVAGLICGLRVELEDGRVMEIVSDASWKIPPNDARSWKQVTQAWEKWPAATVLSFWTGPPDLVYSAQPSEPIVVPLWQRGWVLASLLLAAVVCGLTALFLASRLIIQSRMKASVRRERARIAEDLHDGIGGGLTQMILLGEKARRILPADSAEAATLAELCGQSRGLLGEMDETVWLINSQRDTFRDFASYIVKHAELLFQNSPVRCRFDIEDDLPSLPCDIGTRRNLFMTAKEALNNILRHSQASLAEVGIHRCHQDLVVTIEDNGRGFDQTTTREGNGLRNMAGRIFEAGGQFKVMSCIGAGTKVEFRVPLHASVGFGIARFFRRKRTALPL